MELIKRTLKIFVVEPAQLRSAPQPGPELEVEARSLDGLLEVSARLLWEGGHGKLRSLSYGPEGLVAYVEREAES